MTLQDIDIETSVCRWVTNTTLYNYNLFFNPSPAKHNCTTHTPVQSGRQTDWKKKREWAVMDNHKEEEEVMFWKALTIIIVFFSIEQAVQTVPDRKKEKERDK